MNNLTKRFDLRQDFVEIYTHIAEQVRNFDPAGSNVLGDSGLVKMIEVGYEYEQSGWLVVVFDTRPDANPDGEWTGRIDGNELARPHWFEAGEALFEGHLITIIQLDGTEKLMKLLFDFVDIIGEMLRVLLLKARADGLFTKIPKAPGCELGIEHFDGGYGWPMFEDRGKENLAEV